MRQFKNEAGVRRAARPGERTAHNNEGGLVRHLIAHLPGDDQQPVLGRGLNSGNGRRARFLRPRGGCFRCALHDDLLGVRIMAPSASRAHDRTARGANRVLSIFFVTRRVINASSIRIASASRICAPVPARAARIN